MIDDILTEYRKTCFLVRDNFEKDEAITLMASQNIITKAAIKQLTKDIVSEPDADKRLKMLEAL